MIEPQAQKHDVTMSFFPFDKPCFVHADRTRVKQILINLLSNAIKYNNAGGAVVVECVEQSSDRIRISVKDTGIGLSPEQLAQLFQPFNRLGQETKGEEGTGIGLVMTKRLIELMGGIIGVESTLGLGTVFWIELIRAEEVQPALGDIHHSVLSPVPVQRDHSLRTLLYVEDNPANLKLVEQLIGRRPDVRLLSAGNATLGIALARIHQPEVILMDINLPGISGVKALNILRQDPLTRHIPVVAISANAMPHDIQQGIEAGFFRYITKPIKITEFMDTLDTALRHAASRSVNSTNTGATS
jgi:CheY-like chemotaxis protein